MKSKKTIGKLLFKNYVITIILAMIIFQIGGSICNIIFKIIFTNENFNNIEPYGEYKYNYEDFDTRIIEDAYGWVEILDENKKIIDVRGKKLDNVYQYTEKQLYNLCSMHFINDDKYPYVYNIYPIEGPEGKSYLYVVKFPAKMFKYVFTLKMFSKPQKYSRIHIIMILSILLVYPALFFIGLCFYSKFTAKHIKKPLQYFKYGIKEMENLNYKTRLNFSAEREFGEIKDAFNNMIERLENSESEKEKLTKSKQRMIMDISHDLKTPITSIQGFSKLLYDEEVKNEDERKRYLRYIYNKSIYVTNLINDLFELSKLDDDNLKFIYKKKNFAEWLRQLVSEMYPEFEKKKFNLNIDISEIPIIVYFDEKQMMRAITNLFNNSLKYNPPGTMLWIYCYNEEDKVVLGIFDNGIGIDSDLRETIFNPFVRSDNSRSSKDGTGLGLAITRKIIERHKGTIALSSNKEAATIFTIELPLM